MKRGSRGLFNEVAYGVVTGTDYVHDKPWFNVMVIIRCPDSSLISHKFVTTNKFNIPKKGTVVKLQKANFGYIIAEDF